MSEETKPLSQDAPTHEVLEAAWDHLEKFERGELDKPAAAAAAAAPAAPTEEKTPEELDRESIERTSEKDGRDTRGRFVSKKEPDGAQPPAAPRREAQPEAVSPPPVPAAPVAFKAPQSWRPVERNALEHADPVVQQAVQRREREMEQRLQQAAPHRKFVEEFSETIRPFEPMIHAAGQTPLAAFRNMLNVAQALSTQPELTRAQIISGLMRSYSVSPQTLAQVLTTGAPAAPQAPQQPYQDPRVDQLYSELYELRSAEEQSIARSEDAALEEFSKSHPWLDDVADVMSDMMRVAAERGESLDYEQSYQRALTLRPDLLEIERQRAEETARAQGAPTPDSRNANLSVRGSSRVIARPKKAPASTREAAELAWDELAGDGSRL